jgi:hypothetical protein
MAAGGLAMGAAEVVFASPHFDRVKFQQKAGRVMVGGGFVVTILGVVAYCCACLMGGLDADMGDVLTTNAVPFAHSTLAVLGVGTLLWLVGSFTSLRSAMNAPR